MDLKVNGLTWTQVFQKSQVCFDSLIESELTPVAVFVAPWFWHVVLIN